VDSTDLLSNPRLCRKLGEIYAVEND